VIASLPAGGYDLVVIAPGFGFENQNGVNVAAQTDTGGHDFTLQAADTGGIAGTVSQTNDAMVVTLSWMGFVVATTDADPVTGEYVFEDVPEASYVVVATDGTLWGGVAATVTGGETTTVDISL
jgi:hypothetical protein